MRLAPTLIPLFVVAASAATALGSDRELKQFLHEEPIATVVAHGDSFCLDQKMMKSIDLLAPRLRSLAKGSVIRIEGFSRRGEDREAQVRNSFYLAFEAQKYLRERHGVSADIYLSAIPDGQNSTTDFLRIAVFADAFSAIHVSRAGDTSR
ncbi:hypothetical protein [Geobacter sp.]|uniref:hypothetical protein n=1 Tax=Geobacter sp. TaxID=46610 RepID=UPI0026209421|nr:hypothetical protein [Geobacter sp.]